jgi:hypothetical protein
MGLKEMIETHRARNRFWYILRDLDSPGFRDEEYVAQRLSKAEQLYSKVEAMYPKKAESMRNALNRAEQEFEDAWLRGDFDREKLVGAKAGDYFG